MPREAFYNLLAILRGDLERQLAAAAKSSGGRVEPASRLAIFLRILGGASYLDMQLVFGVGRSTVFQVFYSTLRAINAKLQTPGVPVGDDEKMRANAEAFRASRDPHSPLWGCIGELDGIALAIKIPMTTTFLAIVTHEKGSTPCRFKLVVIPSTSSCLCLRAVSDPRMIRLHGRLVP
jgi:hypothetical protein